MNDNILNEINFSEILEKNINDEIIQKILQLDSEFKIKQLKNYTYISWYHKGISFAFIDEILKNVYVYNEGVQGFKLYDGKLPFNLNLKMLNKNVVEYLGDTNKKGGGRTPIWLSYERIGVEFNFLGGMWDDMENPLINICIFLKQENEDCVVCLKKIEKSKMTCSNKCNLVQYCSIDCRNGHINFHLKYCNI